MGFHPLAALHHELLQDCISPGIVGVQSDCVRISMAFRSFYNYQEAQ